jgi:hypothetical protein
MKRLFIITAFFLAVCSAYAQGYNQAAGIRAGWVSPGLEYRYYISDVHSLKGLLAFRNSGIHLHGLTEFYQYDLFSFSYQIVFFYGAGMHIGFESRDEILQENAPGTIETRSSLVAGIDGIMGLEYLFYEAPVKVGLEVKPFLDVFGHNGLNIDLYDFAFTVKYLF